MTFKKLGLSDPILRSLEDLQHTEPSEIQRQAIPLILSGGFGSVKDVFEVIKKEDVDAVSIASMFHYFKTNDPSFKGERLSPLFLKKCLIKKKIKCRI